VKVVTGYPGGSEVMLAIERKEVDGIARSYSSLEPFFRNKSVKPLLQSAPKRAELATVPLFVDIAPDAMAKAVFNLADAGGLVQRSFAAPPGTPKNNMQILRLAFKNTLEDPQFLADARARKLEIFFMSGEEVQRRWKEIGKTPPKVVEVYKEIMEQR
jgi:tripartite-type tricarboxylate transporter receptor subunit TctC